MTRGPMNICWLDLETTNADENTGAIVEIGAIVTDPDLREVEEISLLVFPDIDCWEAMPEVVQRMHEASGLADEIEDAMAQPDRAEAAYVEEADRILRQFLDRHAVGGQVILAGSGVSHFDHRWIRRHLPRSAKRLTWWAYDVGNVRRFLGSIDEALLRPSPGDKAHRGIVDARDHLNEWKHYRAVVREAITPIRQASARESRALVDVLAPEAVGED